MPVRLLPSPAMFGPTVSPQTGEALSIGVNDTINVMAAIVIIYLSVWNGNYVCRNIIQVSRYLTEVAIEPPQPMAGQGKEPSPYRAGFYL